MCHRSADVPLLGLLIESRRTVHHERSANLRSEISDLERLWPHAMTRNRAPLDCALFRIRAVQSRPQLIIGRRGAAVQRLHRRNPILLILIAIASRTAFAQNEEGSRDSRHLVTPAG